MTKRRNTPAFPVQAGVLLILLLLAAVLGLAFGSTRLTLQQVLYGLFSRDITAVEVQILRLVRLPRVAACLVAGAGLSLSGLLLQTAANNPLAGPNIIGVNAGAGFAMALTMCLAPMASRLVPLAAFGGALLCTVLILLVADRAGGSRVTIVLAGVAVTTLLSAGISLLKLIFPDLALSYHYFSVGGVSGVTMSQLALPAVMILMCLLAAWLLSPRLNLLCLGDPLAQSLGVRVKALRFLTLLLASASAAAAVSFAGLLGFVGLMVPHMARRLLGSGNLRKLIPVSIMLGGSLVILADLLGRVLFAPSEVPAGIITAFIGAPFFFVLLLRRRDRL